MLPTVKNSMKYIQNEDYMNLLERILKLAIPNVYSWIIMFYAFFHSWLNLLAELTKFGDRTFYRDWWNSLYLDEYWRTWNLVRVSINQFSLLTTGWSDTSTTPLEEGKLARWPAEEWFSSSRQFFMSTSFQELWAIRTTGLSLRCLPTSPFRLLRSTWKPGKV